VPVLVTPPPKHETLYPVIAAPPFEVGAENDTVTAPFPAEMDTPVGALGVVTDGEGLGVT
jgi:hypothetical protein